MRFKKKSVEELKDIEYDLSAKLAFKSERDELNRRIGSLERELYGGENKSVKSGGFFGRVGKELAIFAQFQDKNKKRGKKNMF